MEEACRARDVALVCLSHVAYRSGALADMEAITAAAPAPVIWDLSTAPARCEIALAERGVELAVGCTYKYLNAGPGAPAYLYVRDDRQRELRTPIQGWFGQREQFEMERDYDPEPGIRSGLAGTPPIAGPRRGRGGREARGRGRPGGPGGQGARAHRASPWTCRRAPRAARIRARQPARPGAPRRSPEPAPRQAWPITRAMIERAKVIPDFRGPDSIRLGLPPLYTRFTDVYDALERLGTLVERGDHAAFEGSPARIT